MNKKQDRILDTVIFFLEKYKKAVSNNDSATGFEDLVFQQMVETINELREENKRLNELNKPKVIPGGNNEHSESRNID